MVDIGGGGNNSHSNRREAEMAGFAQSVVLGRSGLSVGPLGVAGGYGVPTNALLEAFERGVNYWYHGSRRAGA